MNAVVPPAELRPGGCGPGRGDPRTTRPLSVRAHKAMRRLASPGLTAAVGEAWRLFAPVYASDDAAGGAAGLRGEARARVEGAMT